MMPLTINQMRSSNVDFEDFYNTLRTYGDIIKVIEIDIVTHTKFFKYRNNYFYTKQHRGEVFCIGTTFKEKPDFSDLRYHLKH